MKVLLVTLLLVCLTSGRPSDPPVTREFGTQPNNPNVKIFSTYPTLKPVISRQDNPNDLEKSDNEKLEKDEQENTELKGEELTKIENEEMDAKKNSTEAMISEDEEVMGEAQPPIMTSETSKMEDKDMNQKNESDSIPKDLSSQLIDEEQQFTNDTSSMDNIAEDSPVMVLLPVSEGEAEGDLVTADPNPTIIDEPIVPLTEPELISPIAVETPLEELLPLSNDEFEDDYAFNVPEIEDEEPIFGFGDQTTFLNSGVDLPVLVPFIDTQDENVYAVAEEPTLVPITDEQSLDYFENVSNDSLGQVEPIKPEVEMTKEVLEPMASLTDESVVLEPAVETEGTSSVSEKAENMYLDGEVTESNINMDPMEGDIGVSMPMNENISPIVEAEPEVLPENIENANITEETNTTDLLTDMPVEKYSLKIAKADQVEQASGVEVATELPLEKPNQMAGFMSEESISTPAPSMDETTMPSSTDLSLDLNINDDQNVPTHEEEVLNTEIPDEIEPKQTEPIDNLNMENLEPVTDKTAQSTTESLPSVHPVELTMEEDGNNDVTLNEAL